MVPIDPSSRRSPAADLPELEIRSYGVDRFVVCPPTGALGQPWFPEPPPWSPPESSVGAKSPVTPPPVVDQDYVTRRDDRSPAEMAVEATHRDFRSCYRRGLVHDPAQDGRVAIVLRVGPDGKVAKVEEYGACEIAVESIACMKSVAARLRFPPPEGGSQTITIPAVFTSRDGVRRRAGNGPNDAYTASAYLTLESARPGLHACVTRARLAQRALEATGTFTLDIAQDGKVTHAHVDPWAGEQSLLVCAAGELEKLKFGPAPSGAGVVIARVNFNPRQGTR